MKKLLVIAGVIAALSGCSVQATMSAGVIGYHEVDYASSTNLVANVMVENTGNVDINRATVTVTFELDGDDPTTGQAQVSLNEGQSKEIQVVGSVNYSGATIEKATATHTIDDHETRGLF